jgi:hypothetical protein
LPFAQLDVLQVHLARAFGKLVGLVHALRDHGRDRHHGLALAHAPEVTVERLRVAP